MDERIQGGETLPSCGEQDRAQHINRGRQAPSLLHLLQRPSPHPRVGVVPEPAGMGAADAEDAGEGCLRLAAGHPPLGAPGHHCPHIPLPGTLLVGLPRLGPRHARWVSILASTRACAAGTPSPVP